MIIKTMPTTMFKTKWNIFMTKLSPTINELPCQQQQQQQRRRRSSSSDENNKKRRKHSDAMSVGTFESNITMADKFRSVIPFFRRRSSSIISTNEEVVSAPATCCSTANTSTIQLPPQDYCKQLEKLQSLYTLAVDELNYAEDSQGSSYYSGDLIAAREALDDCANTFIQLLAMTDIITREGLQSSMTPKLLLLEKKLDALPEPNDTDVY